MSVIIGKVSSSDDGKFYVKNPDGTIRELSVGDKIYEGDIVLGDKYNSSSDRIITAMKNGSDIILLGSQTQLFDASLFQNEFSEDETVTQEERHILNVVSNSNT